MIRSRTVIPAGNGGILTYKNRTGISYPRKRTERVSDLDGKVLGGKRIDRVDSFSEAGLRL